LSLHCPIIFAFCSPKSRKISTMLGNWITGGEESPLEPMGRLVASSRHACTLKGAGIGSDRLVVVVYKQLPLKVVGDVCCGGFEKVPAFTRELTQKHLFVFPGQFGDNEISGRS
jgi:hypothetical protein